MADGYNATVDVGRFDRACAQAMVGFMSADELQAFKGNIHETTAPVDRVLTNDEAMALVPRPMGKPEVVQMEEVLVSAKEIFLH